CDRPGLPLALFGQRPLGVVSLPLRAVAGGGVADDVQGRVPDGPGEVPVAEHAAVELVGESRPRRLDRQPHHLVDLVVGLEAVEPVGAHPEVLDLLVASVDPVAVGGGVADHPGGEAGLLDGLAWVLFALGEGPVVVARAMDHRHLDLAGVVAPDEDPSGGRDDDGPTGAHRLARWWGTGPGAGEDGGSAAVRSIDTAPQTKHVWRVNPPPTGFGDPYLWTPRRQSWWLLRRRNLACLPEPIGHQASGETCRFRVGGAPIRDGRAPARGGGHGRGRAGRCGPPRSTRAARPGGRPGAFPRRAARSYRPSTGRREPVVAAGPPPP